MEKNNDRVGVEEGVGIGESIGREKMRDKGMRKA